LHEADAVALDKLRMAIRG